VRLTCLTLVFFSLGAEAAVWDTKVEVSMMVRLQAGTEVPLGQVDQVGMVLPAGVRVTALPAEAAEALVVTVVTEDISNERVQEVSTTGTQSDHDTRCLAIAPDQLICNFLGGMIAFFSSFSLSLLALLSLCLSFGLVSISQGDCWLLMCSKGKYYTRIVYS
jgi:hypothetical protein